MQYSLDTDPPTFPGGVTRENIFAMLDGLQSDFSTAVRVLPHAVAHFVYSYPGAPLDALSSLKREVDEKFATWNTRIWVYPLMFGSLRLCPLIDEQFGEFQRYLMQQYDSGAIFEAGGSIFGLSETSEAPSDYQAEYGCNSFSTMLATYPGCYLASYFVLDRFKAEFDRMTAASAQRPRNENIRFVLSIFKHADQRFLAIYEIAEFAIFALSSMAVCTNPIYAIQSDGPSSTVEGYSLASKSFSAFEAVCERVFGFLGDLQNASLISAQYRGLQRLYAGGQAACVCDAVLLNAYAQYIVWPRATYNKQLSIRTLYEIIDTQKLTVNNVFRLLAAIADADFKTAFYFSYKLRFDIFTAKLSFNAPFVEEETLDSEILEIVDEVIAAISDDQVACIVDQASDWKNVSQTTLVFLLRALTLRKQKVTLGNLADFCEFYKHNEAYLSLLAYDRNFFSATSLPCETESFYALFARFLIENFEDSMRPHIEEILARTEQDDRFREYNNYIVQTFLKSNSDYVQLNLNTYLKLYRRNDNLVLQLANLFFQGKNDCYLAMLALYTLRSADGIQYDVVKVLTTKLFDFAMQFLYAKATPPTEAIACMTAFYSSYDIAPYFCGAVNGLRGDFFRVFDNLRLADANILLLPGLLLLMTSLFEVPVQNTIDILHTYLQSKTPENLVQESDAVSDDFASFSFVYCAAIRLILLNGVDNSDISPDAGKRLVDIFLFYTKAAMPNYQLIAAFVDALVEAFYEQYGSIMVIFKRFGRILSQLADMDLKQCSSYVEKPIGLEILTLAIGGLICFEFGPQWNSSYYINARYIGTLLQHVAEQQVVEASDAQILRQIYAVKYVRNALMGDYTPTNQQYKQYIQSSKKIITLGEASQQLYYLYQAAISLLACAMAGEHAAQLECKPQSYLLADLLSGCKCLSWEDENSLLIVFDMLSGLSEKHALRGKALADVQRVLGILEQFLPEDESSENEAD